MCRARYPTLTLKEPKPKGTWFDGVFTPAQPPGYWEDGKFYPKYRAKAKPKAAPASKPTKEYWWNKD